jgi:hypothetical protein
MIACGYNQGTCGTYIRQCPRTYTTRSHAVAAKSMLHLYWAVPDKLTLRYPVTCAKKAGVCLGFRICFVRFIMAEECKARNQHTYLETNSTMSVKAMNLRSAANPLETIQWNVLSSSEYPHPRVSGDAGLGVSGYSQDI